MVLTKLKNWYGKYERPISSISLVGGFVFDALTLKRVDLFWENFWVIAHLLIVGTGIILVHAVDKGEGDEANPSKTHFWLVNIIQFFFGGILSTYLVFYFRSSDIAASWPFLLILGLSFWANEALKKHYTRLVFQISLFYLSLFAFAIFLVPVLEHKIGAVMFLVSGLVSLVAISLFLLIIWFVNHKVFQENKNFLIATIAGIFILINFLYFTDIIPPIPLSLKDAGVYYAIQRNFGGDYLTTGEHAPWQNYFKLYPDFHALPGQPVFVYSAIFSPPGLNIEAVHEWQYYDQTSGKWLTESRVNLHIVGGRDGGFRTYSEKTTGLLPGHWRVNVLTSNGQLIGRVRFNLVFADSLPTVEQKLNQ
jgi:Protein of unknown function (DUF2914)